MSQPGRIHGSEVLIKLRNMSSVVELFTSLSQQRERSQFVDVVLVSEDKHAFDVHACVVAAQSAFLHQLLAQLLQGTGASVETHGKPREIPSTVQQSFELHQDSIKNTPSVKQEQLWNNSVSILLESVSGTILEICVDYMYGKEVVIKNALLKDLLFAANLLKLKGLESQCQKCMQVTFSVSNSPKSTTTKEDQNSKRKSLTNLDTANTGDFNSETENHSLGELISDEYSMEIDSNNLFISESSKPSTSGDIYEVCKVKINNVPSSSYNNTVSNAAKLDTTVSATKQATESTESVVVSDMSFYFDLSKGELKLAEDVGGQCAVEFDQSVVQILQETFGHILGESTASLNTATKATGGGKSEPEKVVKGSNKTTPNRGRVKYPHHLRRKRQTEEEAREKKRLYKQLSKKKEHFCEKCGLKIIGSYQFRSHMSKVHKKNHVCKHCGRTFYHPKAMHEHVARHEQKFRHMCDQCNYKCVSMSELTCHTESKHGTDRFYCSQCPNSYRSFAALRFHTKIHKVLLKCDECDFTYSHQYQIRRHKHSVHLDNIVECKLCGRIYRNTSMVQKHLKKVHGVFAYMRRTRRVAVPDEDGVIDEDAIPATEEDVLNKEGLLEGHLDEFAVVRPRQPGETLRCERTMHAPQNSSTAVMQKQSRKMEETFVETSGQAQGALSGNVIDQSAVGSGSVDLNDVTSFVLAESSNLDLVEECGDVIYIEAGTGRILRADEVAGRELEIVSTAEMTGEEMQVDTQSGFQRVLM